MEGYCNGQGQGNSMTANIGARETKVNTNDNVLPFCCGGGVGPTGPLTNYILRNIMPTQGNNAIALVVTNTLYVLHCCVLSTSFIFTFFRLPRLARGSGVHPCQ